MINTEYDKKICSWITQNREKILADWMELVRIPSVHGEAEPLAPYGKDCARALKKAAEYFSDRGFPVRVNEEDGYALADYGDGEKTIGIFGHSDVVPTGDGWKYTEPFAPIVCAGTLIGRGSRDNKSGVIASMCVLSILRDCNIPVKNRIRAFIGSNEESGMGDITAFVAKETMPDMSFVPDSSFPCSLGEKGILRMWAQCDEKLEAIRDFSGGTAFNVVLDHVTVTLQSNRQLEAELRSKIGDNTAYALAVEADGTLRLEAFGVAKHAGGPEGSVNATALAAALLAQCEALPAVDRKPMQTVAQLLESPFGEGMGIAYVDEEFGRLTAANGMVAVCDGKLRVSLDIRYGTSLPGEELEEKLHRVWGEHGWKIVHMHNRKGFSVDPNSPVPQIMHQLYKDVTGTEKDLYRMAGGTYSRYLKNAFTVGVWADDANRTTEPMKFPAGHGGAHQRDEGLDIEGFFQAIRLLTHAVIQCDDVI